MIKRQSLVSVIVTLCLAAVGGRFVAAVNQWEAPAVTDFPPLFSDVELIISDGVDGLGNHQASMPLDMNGQPIYNIGTTDKDQAVEINSVMNGPGLQVEASNNDAVYLLSDEISSTTLSVRNASSGYGLVASSSSGLAARFNNHLAIQTAVSAEIPGLGWRLQGQSLYNYLSPISSGLSQSPDLNLYWGSQLLCSAGQVNCGRVANTSGDNLGSHKADYNLDMNGRSITAVSNLVRRNFLTAGQATTSLETNHVGTGVALSAVSGAYGLQASTNLNLGTQRRNFPSTDTGQTFSAVALYHDRIYWGTRNTGFFTDILRSHGGVVPEEDWRDIPIRDLCENLDLNVVDMMAYGDQLYLILKSDVSVPGHPLYRLLRYDDSLSAQTQCFTFSSLPKDSSVKVEDFNGLSALAVYRNKLYGFTTSSGLSPGERCQLLSYDGNQWKRETRVNNSNCGSAMRMLTHGQWLYLQHDDAFTTKVYRYNGTAMTAISPTLSSLPSVRIAGLPIPAGWLMDNNDLLIGAGDGRIYRYASTNGAWSVAHQLVTLASGDGPSDILRYEGGLYANQIQGGGTSVGYYYDPDAAAWINASVGYRAQTYRGSLLSPLRSNVKLALPTAVSAYSGGNGYGLYGASLLGPGARLYGHVQILPDSDNNTPEQLTLGNDSNRLSTVRATSTADSDLYWSNRLICRASDPNCGYISTATNEVWSQNAQGDLFTNRLVNIGLPNAGQVPSSYKLQSNFVLDQNFALRDTTLLPGNAHGASALEGNRLYVLTNNDIAVYDVSNSADTIFLGLINPALNIIKGSDIVVRDQIAFISLPGQGLYVVDVSAPGVSSPDEYLVEAQTIQNPSVITLIGERAFVGSAQNATNPQNLMIFSIAIPFDSSLVNRVSSGGVINDLEAQGQYLYVAHDPGGLQVWDIGSQTPTLIADEPHPLYSALYGKKIALWQNDVFIHFGGIPEGGLHHQLVRYSLANPTNPIMKQYYYIDATIDPKVTDLAIINDRYLIASHSDYSRAVIYNIDREIGGVGYPSIIVPPDPLIGSIEVYGTQVIFVGYDQSASGAESIYTYDFPGVRLQQAIVGQFAATQLQAQSLTVPNLYAQSGLHISGDLSLQAGSARLPNGGKIRIGTQGVIDETLLNQLLQWLNS